MKNDSRKWNDTRSDRHFKPGTDHLIMRPKKVKLAERDMLLKKFRHKEAPVAALNGKNPENVVAVMEELVAKKKLLICVSNLDVGELGLLLRFLQRYSTMPRYASFFMGLARKVVDMRAEDIRSSSELRGHIRNLKRDVEEEIRLLGSLREIEGMIRPLMRIANILLYVVSMSYLFINMWSDDVLYGFNFLDQLCVSV